MKSRIALCGLLLIGLEKAGAAEPPPQASAQAPAQAAKQAAPRAMSLNEALAFAREHQPSLLAAQARIAAAQAAAQVPRAQWTPQVGATAQAIVGTTNNSTASYFSSTGVDLPRIGSTPVNPSSPSFAPSVSTLLGVGLRQEVYDFGRISAQAAAADAQIAVAEQQADVERLNIALMVTDAYYGVQAARSIVTASEEAYQRTKVHRDAAAAGVASGLRRPLDLTRAEADLTRFDVGRIRAQGALRNAQAVFAAAVGAPDALLDAAGTESTTAALPELNQAVEAALSRNPTVRASEAALTAQQQQTQAIGSELRPNLFASATVSTRAGGATANGNIETTGAGVLPLVPNYDAGLVLSWPLLDRTVTKRQETSQQLESVRQEEIATTKLQLTAQVQQAYLDAQLADEALPALERSAAAAKANSDQAQARFSTGMSTSLEVADAEALRVDAEIQLAVGRFEQGRARARLARAMGEGL